MPFLRKKAPNLRACSGIVSAITGRTMKGGVCETNAKRLSANSYCKRSALATITANEPAAEDYRDKNIRFDIACKAVGGEYLDVEIFTAPHKFEAVRLEFFAARLFTSQDYADREIVART